MYKIDVFNLLDYFVVTLMARFFNFLLFTILCLSIYETFSVKKNVGKLAEDIATLEEKIVDEKKKIAIYEMDLSSLTKPARIESLVVQLLPNMKLTRAEQICASNELNKNTLQLASQDIAQQQDYATTGYQEPSLNDYNIFTASSQNNSLE